MLRRTSQFYVTLPMIADDSQVLTWGEAVCLGSLGSSAMRDGGCGPHPEVRVLFCQEPRKSFSPLGTRVLVPYSYPFLGQILRAGWTGFIPPSTIKLQSLAKPASPSGALPEFWPRLKVGVPVGRLARHREASAVTPGCPCTQYAQISCKIYPLIRNHLQNIFSRPRPLVT
jgi:hypothetical protein